MEHSTAESHDASPYESSSLDYRMEVDEEARPTIINNSYRVVRIIDNKKFNKTLAIAVCSDRHGRLWLIKAVNHSARIAFREFQYEHANN